MVSHGNRYAIAFNGEIYNHTELRSELNRTSPGVHWKGRSDTEVLLAMVEHCGVKSALGRCVGMFAFALWDRLDRTLWLGRDRLGEKPIYWGKIGDVLLFGSQLDALRASPAASSLQVDRSALALMMRYGYVPSPYSIYEGVRKLAPGTLLRVDHTTGKSTEEEFWSFRGFVPGGPHPRWQGTTQEAVDELERLLKRSIGQQMVADVPVGAFLSGGVDSSTVVALAQGMSGRSVQTFSIGFHSVNITRRTRRARLHATWARIIPSYT